MFGIGSKVPQVSAEDIKSRLEGHDGIVIIDVRTEPEFSRGKIGGSINIPLDRIESVESEIPDKNKEIYVYCLSGSRSVVAVEYLMKMGYTNVKNITSGILAWRAKQYPLVEDRI